MLVLHSFIFPSLTHSLTYSLVYLCISRTLYGLSACSVIVGLLCINE